MDQIRAELSQRLVERVFREGEWSKKWWMTFVKRNFMNLELSLVFYVCLNKSEKLFTQLLNHIN